MLNKPERIYGARDTITGKLVSDITNPRRKYWDKKGNAEKAIEAYNRSYANTTLGSRSCWSNKGEHGLIELVTFELIEVKD
jgi:hypothetical protein